MRLKKAVALLGAASVVVSLVLLYAAVTRDSDGSLGQLWHVGRNLENARPKKQSDKNDSTQQGAKEGTVVRGGCG